MTKQWYQGRETRLLGYGIQQQEIRSELAAEVDSAEIEYQRERHAAHVTATAQQRAAEFEAKLRAEEEARAAAERARKAAAAAAARKRRAAEATKPYTGPIPASCNEYSGNRQIGCAVLLDSGFGIDQMPCLDKLWTKESGWNPSADNPTSSAYGIPQALPGEKMASAGADWATNPATQIKWGLGYIAEVYGSPCSAWAHSQANNWY